MKFGSEKPPVSTNGLVCPYLAFIGLVAQRLEQATHNRLVAGSNPAGPTFTFMETPPLPPTPPALPPAQGNDKLWIVLCHLSLILGVGFILPLIVFLVKRDESPLVGEHAKEVLNFHISLLIYSICTIPFVFILIGIPMYMALGLMAFICAIIAAIKASEGGFYRYPLTIRLIS
jgi:uncharacterized Tic20 family protein